LVRGGVVEKSSKGWGIGIARNEMIRQPEWMHPHSEELNMLVSHQDQITK